MDQPYAQVHFNASLYNYTHEELHQFQDDGAFTIATSFTIFTMQSGFGLLESGRVSAKDEVNIMMKNVIDVLFGGLMYWMFGFGLSFGDHPSLSNWFCGIGKFFYDPSGEDDENDEGWSYAAFLFQLSFATTTSTIVSGAMAERTRLRSYIVVSSLLVLLHAIPAHWVWAKNGLFRQLGAIDFAGCSAVHLVGGVVGLVATIYLKPRANRFGERGIHQMSNPTNAVLGAFMLWWGWLAFNTGSTNGVTQRRWRHAARSAVSTILSSVGGGCTSIVLSVITTKKCQVDLLVDGLLASLVSCTAICAVATPWQSLLIGSIGSGLAIAVYPLMERLEIDDPVGIVPVHVVASTWGMLSVGIFTNADHFDLDMTHGRSGLLYSGSFYLLGVQALTVLTVSIWSAVCGFLVILIIDKSPWGLRLTKYEEMIGADLIEHGLAGHNIARYRVEKKLTTKSFTSVLKALTKWKRLARRGRALRLQQLQLEQQPTVDANLDNSRPVEVVDNNHHHQTSDQYTFANVHNQPTSSLKTQLSPISIQPISFDLNAINNDLPITSSNDSSIANLYNIHFDNFRRRQHRRFIVGNQIKQTTSMIAIDGCDISRSLTPETVNYTTIGNGDVQMSINNNSTVIVMNDDNVMK